MSMVPRFRFVVEALLRAIPGIMSIAGLLVIVFYVAAVMATGLFGERFPEWFGSIGESMYTLFQVMTLESWSMGIARPVIEVILGLGLLRAVHPDRHLHHAEPVHRHHRQHHAVDAATSSTTTASR
jgi:hypothetical protein